MKKINVLKKLNGSFEIINNLDFKKNDNVERKKINNYNLTFDNVSQFDIDKVLSSLNKKQLKELANNYIEPEEIDNVRFYIDPIRGSQFSEDIETLSFTSSLYINNVPQKVDKARWYLNDEILGYGTVISVSKYDIEVNKKAILSCEIGDHKTFETILNYSDEEDNELQPVDPDEPVDPSPIDDIGDDEEIVPIEALIEPYTSDSFDSEIMFQELMFKSILVDNRDDKIIEFDNYEAEWRLDDDFMDYGENVTINRQMMGRSPVKTLSLSITYNSEKYTSTRNINNFINEFSPR